MHFDVTICVDENGRDDFMAAVLEIAPVPMVEVAPPEGSPEGTEPTWEPLMSEEDWIKSKVCEHVRQLYINGKKAIQRRLASSPIDASIVNVVNE